MVRFSSLESTLAGSIGSTFFHQHRIPVDIVTVGGPDHSNKAFTVSVNLGRPEERRLAVFLDQRLLIDLKESVPYRIRQRGTSFSLTKMVEEKKEGK